MEEKRITRASQADQFLELVFFRGLSLQVAAKLSNISIRFAEKLLGFYKTRAFSRLELADFVAGLRFRFAKRVTLWQELYRDADTIKNKISVLSQIRAEDEVLHKALGSLGVIPKHLGSIDQSISVSWESGEDESIKEEVVDVKED
jgi:hypothetical protein